MAVQVDQTKVESARPTPDGELATDQEIYELWHVADSLPARVWIASLIGMVQRFGYYGTQSVFQNYLQNNPTDLIPGALGLGKSRATTVNSAFTVLVNVLPLPSSVLVDGRLGRYRSLQLFTAIYALGSAVLFATSFPSMMGKDLSIGGFSAGAILIAVGFGGLQASLQPVIADQYTEQALRIKTTKSGERVVVDRELTIQYIYNLYYWMVNFGSLGSIATTLMEKYIGFWSAYLLDFCAIVLCSVIVQLAGSIFIQVPTQEGVLPRAFRCICLAVRGGFKLNAALPENQFRTHSRVVPWDESFIQELRDGLSAFKICAGWPIFWMCMAEGAQLSISQAGQMATHRIPNDLIKSANPVAYVVIGLFVQNVLYPYLQQRQIKFGPVDRITSGFIIMSIAMVYAAIVRALIYRAAPCYRYPLACAASNSGNIPNQVHVLIQLPQFVIIALGEVFCWPTGRYALAMALSPLTRDPLLLLLWGLVSGLMFLTACVFRFAFRNY